MIDLVTLSCGYKEYAFFQWLARLDRAARYGYRADDSQARAVNHSFGRRVEQLAGDLLRDRGYTVKATSHKAHHDLWVDGCKVEIKASRFDGQRWQFNLRGNRADVYLLACVGADHRVIAWFVIPSEAIGDRRHIAIWCADLVAYSGRWAEFRGAWGLLDAAAAGTSAPWQLQLWG